MTTIRILVTILVSLFSFSVLAAPEWRQKPVQCGSSETAMKILEEHNEKAIVGGLTNVKGPKGNNAYFPFYLFVNSETGTFTIIEYHLDSNEVCVIGYGNGIDFDVQKLFEPKTSS